MGYPNTIVPDELGELEEVELETDVGHFIAFWTVLANGLTAVVFALMDGTLIDVVLAIASVTDIIPNWLSLLEV